RVSVWTADVDAIHQRRIYEHHAENRALHAALAFQHDADLSPVLLLDRGLDVHHLRERRLRLLVVARESRPVGRDQPGRDQGEDADRAAADADNPQPERSAPRSRIRAVLRHGVYCSPTAYANRGGLPAAFERPLHRSARRNESARLALV